MKFEPTRLIPEVEHRCAALLDELGLVFGCFDFIVTPEGEYMFLEVNEMGQFLFLERCCDLPLLDAFSEFLLQGRVDFQWSYDSVQVRYAESQFERAAIARFNEFQSSHCELPDALAYEE